MTGVAADRRPIASIASTVRSSDVGRLGEAASSRPRRTGRARHPATRSTGCAASRRPRRPTADAARARARRRSADGPGVRRPAASRSRTSARRVRAPRRPASRGDRLDETFDAGARSRISPARSARAVREPVDTPHVGMGVASVDDVDAVAAARSSRRPAPRISSTLQDPVPVCSGPRTADRVPGCRRAGAWTPSTTA